MKLKRLFVGINIPKDTKEKLFSLAQSNPEIALLPVKWANSENLHMTLEFLGYADEDQTCQIAKRFHDIVRDFAPFPVYFDKISFGPKEGLSELIWALGPKNIFLEELNKKIIADLSDIYLIKRKRKFKFFMHITLGRLSKQDAKNISEIYEKKTKDLMNIKLSFTATEIALMESFKERNKTKYAILENVKLR